MSRANTDMTIEQIEDVLVGYSHSPFYCRSHLVVPNVSWGFLDHEADLLVMSKARLLTEIEIKRSWSDFIADFKKAHDHSHPLIARCYYAVPSSIGQRVFDYLYNGEYDAKYWYSKSRVNSFTEHNPHGYGLIVYDLDGGWQKNKCCITVGSKLLNNSPISETQEKDLLRLLGLRVWGLKRKLAKLKKRRDETNIDNN